MADFNYLKSVNTADKLIAKFGGKLKGMIIRPQSTGGVRPTPLPSLTYPCTCVVVDYTDRERNNTSIKETSKRMLVSPKNLEITLETTDTIRGPDGIVYKIVPPMSLLKPRDILVLYDLQVGV